MTIESVFEANKEACPARYKVPGTGQEDIHSCVLNNHNKYCDIKNCPFAYWSDKLPPQPEVWGINDVERTRRKRIDEDGD